VISGIKFSSAILLLGVTFGLGVAFGVVTPVNEAKAQDCLTIERITLQGVSKLNTEDVQETVDANLGCLPLETWSDTLNYMLETVTLAYVEAGYVAARAYLPEQDLSDGELQIAVLEGEVSDIIILENGERVEPVRALTAFPGMEGDALRLRALEQGLAQINRLPTSNATAELVPGNEPGTTAVQVSIDQRRPWQASLYADNRGTETTGKNNFGVILTYDNLVNANDRWTVSYQRSTDPAPALNSSAERSEGEPLGRAFSLSGSIPYGFWTFGIGISESDYITEIDGISDPIELTGESESLRLSAERLITLSPSGRWDAGAALTWKDSTNEILGTRIDTSSRTLTNLDGYVRRTQPLFGGFLSTTATVRKGVTLLGAFDDDEAPPGSPTAQYIAYLGDLSYRRAWNVAGQQIVWSSGISGQFSQDRLFGSEEFSLGGFSSVRGSRTSLFFSNSGIEGTNTISAPQLIDFDDWGTFTPYVGLDAGHIFAPPDSDQGPATLASFTLGLTLDWEAFNVDLTYSRPFEMPDEIRDQEDGVLTIQGRITF